MRLYLRGAQRRRVRGEHACAGVAAATAGRGACEERVMVAIPLRAHARRTSGRTAAAMLFLSLGCSTADDEEPKGATTGTGTGAASASNTATTGASIGGGGAEAGGSGASDGGGGSTGMGGHGGVGASCDPRASKTSSA